MLFGYLIISLAKKTNIIYVINVHKNLFLYGTPIFMLRMEQKN